MIEENIFTNIYFKSGKDGYINVLLLNKEKSNSIFFDGLNFHYQKGVLSEAKEFKEIDYSKNLQNKTFKIEAIKQSWHISYVRLDNGDIFQLYFMADDRQHLSVFTKREHSSINTPLGISLYDSILKNFNEADEFTISIEG